MTGVKNGFVPLESVDYHAVGVSMTDAKENPFMIAQRQLDDAAKILKLDDATHDMLRWPLREMHARLPVRMDDGRVKVFHGFRVQYSDARGPCKGGIRFHPHETIDTVRALAAWMTWKTAAVHEAAKKHKVHNRLAAYLVAVSRVAEAMKLRGWV